MSFIYSLALAEESWPANNLDTDASAPLSGNLTPKPSLWHDKMMAVSRLSRFGMMCKPLTDGHGAALLTLWLAASHARTYPSPAKAQESTEPAAACGDTWRGSLARFDPATSSWRTVQPSLLEDLGESSVIWPRSGMTANGQCWELPTLGRRISGTGSGLWLGTPTATMSVRSEPFRRGAAPTPAEFVKWPTPTASQARSEGMIMQLRTLVDAGTLTREEAEMMAQGSLTPPRMKPWPKPTTRDRGTDAPNRTGGPSLAVAVRTWPTPTVCGNYNRKGASATSGDGLATAVLKCATPTARDWKSGKASQATHDRNSRPLSEQIGGSLNPTWVEWLMGWPLGWTDLKPLATDKFQPAQPPLGES